MESVQSDSPQVKFDLSPRNKFYAKIGEKLSEGEVKSLRASLITDNHINKGKIENATPHEIFNMLEDGGKIGEGNLGLLKELLKGLGQEQLAKEAENLEKVDLIKLASTSKRKATEDAGSAKQKRMSYDSEGADDSDSSAESGIGCPSTSLSPEDMPQAGWFESGDLMASPSCSADGSTLETVGDVRKRIDHLRTKIAKLTRYPNNISKTKSQEVSKACQELNRLVKLLEEQGSGELNFDIALLNTETRDEFQETRERGTLQQEIGKGVKHIMRSTSDDIVHVKPEVKVEFSSNTSHEGASVCPGRRATIKVTAEEVELADSCKLDKDSAVRRLFKYLVENSQELRLILKYLNSFYVQVRDISYGSIDFECLCLTPESAVRLQQEYDGKNLRAQFQRVISSLAILTTFGIKSIFLAVDLKFADEGAVARATSSTPYPLHLTPVLVPLGNSDCEVLTNVSESSELVLDYRSLMEDQDDNGDMAEQWLKRMPSKTLEKRMQEDKRAAMLGDDPMTNLEMLRRESDILQQQLRMLKEKIWQKMPKEKRNKETLEPGMVNQLASGSGPDNDVTRNAIGIIAGTDARGRKEPPKPSERDQRTSQTFDFQWRP